MTKISLEDRPRRNGCSQRAQMDGFFS